MRGGRGRTTGFDLFSYEKYKRIILYQYQNIRLREELA